MERHPHRNTRYLPFLLAGLAVLIMTNSRASIGWVLVSFLMFPISRMSSGIRLVFVLGVLMLFLAFSDTLILETMGLLTRDNYGVPMSQFVALLSGRSEAWEVGLRSFSEHPLLGLGVGSEERLLREHASALITHSGEHMHSSYLSILVETGMLGTGILVLTLIMTVARGFRQVRVQRRASTVSWPTAVLSLAILVGALVHASVETWLLNPGNVNALMFWTLVAYSISSSSTFRAQPHARAVPVR